MRVCLTLQAIQDLRDIRAYLAPRSPLGAERVRASIESTVDLLALFPHIARDTDIESVRVVPVTGYPYLVYHRMTTGAIVVIHIRHTSRDTPTINDLDMR